VFWLKKLVSFWLMPLPLCLGLLVCGLLLTISRRRQKLGRLLVLTSAFLLVLASNRLVSARLLRPLEARYPAIPEAANGAVPPAALTGCRFVAVLGSGHGDIPGLSATNQLSTAGLARIVEAVRLLRLLPDARLVVSGPGEPGRPSHAEVLAQAARSLGVSPERITLIDTARDTEDEALAFASVVGKNRTALVTSASHMPRAAHLFRKAGIDFVACPADFVARSGTALRWANSGWDSESLGRTTIALHEWLGLAWLRLRGA
jgi:uncharacterized SAM-binding protein YcdF (DUF218 family)